MEEKIKMIAEHYGLKKQLNHTMQECGELIAAISRRLDNPCIKEYQDNLLEEIADVKNMLMQLEILTGEKKRIERIQIEKIERQIGRIKAERGTYEK